MGEKILVVDDEVSMREMMHQALEEGGTISSWRMGLNQPWKWSVKKTWLWFSSI